MNADRNIFELSGRLVRDIKLGETKDGRTYGMITVLYRGKKEKKPQFFEAFIWNEKLLEFYGMHLKSGKRVFIRGELSKQEKQIYINVTEDYGVMICIDTRDLKSAESGSEAWIQALEKEDKRLEEEANKREEKRKQDIEELEEFFAVNGNDNNIDNNEEENE